MKTYIPTLLMLLLVGCKTPDQFATITFTIPRYNPTCPECGNTFVSPPVDWYTTGGSSVQDTNNATIYNKSEYTIWFRCPACKRKFSAATYQTNAPPQVLFPIGQTAPSSGTELRAAPPMPSIAAAAAPTVPPITTPMELGARPRYNVTCINPGCERMQTATPVSSTYLSQGTDTTNVWTTYKLEFICRYCGQSFICHTKTTTPYPKMVYPIRMRSSVMSPPMPPTIVRAGRLPQATMPDRRPEPRIWTK